jgi:hypothetical protein
MEGLLHRAYNFGAALAMAVKGAAAADIRDDLQSPAFEVLIDEVLNAHSEALKLWNEAHELLHTTPLSKAHEFRGQLAAQLKGHR